MTDPVPSWEEILSAAEEELHAFDSAISLFQARMSELRDAMTKKLYDELRRELDQTESAWDILVGVALTAAGGAIAAASTRLVLSNIMRGWAVMTTVRTVPIVITATSERYVSGITAAQMLAGLRRQSLMKEITTPGRPLYEANEDVVDLLASATTALVKHGLSPDPGSQPTNRPAVRSRQPRPGVTAELTPEAAKLREDMPLSTEQDRFTIELQEQHHKAELLLRSMRSIIAELEHDPDLDAALRKEWRTTEEAIDKLAGSNSGAYPGADPAPAAGHHGVEQPGGRIPPGSSGATLEVHKRYLKLLYANQWTNTVAFLQFGPSHQLGTIRPDAYQREDLDRATALQRLHGTTGPPRQPFYPNVPYRVTYPHWWSRNERKTAAYFVEDEGYETEIISLKNAAAAEAMTEVLADPESDFRQTYLEYAARIVSLPTGPGLTEPNYGRGRLNLQTLANAAKDQAFQRMFADVDQTWLRLRVIPAAKALLADLRRMAPAQFPSVRSIRDGLDRAQQ